MNTREKRLLRNSITMALALLVLAPLASFAWGLSVGVGVGAPGYYRPAGYYAPYYAPAYYPYYPSYGPYYGRVWIAPHWGGYGYHRVWIRGYWGYRHHYPYHYGYYRRW
jgi:hypothetical protein